MSKPNYHARMMNISPKVADEMRPRDVFEEGILKAYKLGHRDARHAAAEIASEADAMIAELRQALLYALPFVELMRGDVLLLSDALDKSEKNL